MGYYDQDYEHLQKKQKGNRRRWLISALIGGVLGALLILFFVPTILNWYPYNQALTGGRDGNSQIKGTGTNDGMVRNVSVQVTTAVTEAVDRVSEAVVGVVNLQQASFWDNGNENAEEAGTGSGVIYKQKNGSAYVVTNHHVIEGANQVEVSLSDGTRVAAKVLGSDVWTDLAVLEIDDEHVTKVAQFGNSDLLRAGEPVIAIGNPLGLQFSGSVTQGIISGVNRTIPIDVNRDGIYDWNADVLQTDAAINPGNSGGALVNIDGLLIGINSMKIAQEAVEGIGLAIPINYAQPIIQNLEEHGEVRRPFMGISHLKALYDISSYHLNETLHLPHDVSHGVAILEVMPLSPAAQAGLKELDVIVELDGEPITDVIELRKHLYTEKQIGERMEVTFYRAGERQQVSLKLAEEEY